MTAEEEEKAASQCENKEMGEAEASCTYRALAIYDLGIYLDSFGEG